MKSFYVRSTDATHIKTLKVTVIFGNTDHIFSDTYVSPSTRHKQSH